VVRHRLSARSWTPTNVAGRPGEPESRTRSGRPNDGVAEFQIEYRDRQLSRARGDETSIVAAARFALDRMSVSRWQSCPCCSSSGGMADLHERWMDLEARPT